MHRLLFPFLIFSLVIAGNSWCQDAASNDECGNAAEIQVGQRISGASNFHATLSATRPGLYPATCIQTYENDLWYKFTTIQPFTFYKVFLTYMDCSAPSGMQGIILENPDCSPDGFIYRACANYRNMDTIALLFQEKEPGKEMIIYLDGFDGTICTFDLWLEGFDTMAIAKQDYRHHKFDFDVETAPPFLPTSCQSKFTNNALTITWSLDGSEDADYFLVENVRSYEESGPAYSQILAVIEPKANVAGSDTYYEYTDYSTPFRNGIKYCFRVVKVDSKGTKYYGEILCREASVAENFYVTGVQFSKELPNSAVMHYINYRKNQNFKIELLDAEHNSLKSMELKKEPMRDGDITIDMTAYPQGVYYIKMDNGENSFIRSFEKTLPAASGSGSGQRP